MAFACQQSPPSEAAFQFRRGPGLEPDAVAPYGVTGGVKIIELPRAEWTGGMGMIVPSFSGGLRAQGAEL
jgi:hypothetical protein